MIITSFSNPKVKSIRKLDQRKFRQETGFFLIEGLHTVGEAVQTGAPIETLVVAPDLLVSDFGKTLLDETTRKGIEILEVSAKVYEKIAHKDGPQGIGAVIRQTWDTFDQITIHSDDTWVALDAISDPGNLGTILRTADAVGARGILLLGNSTDPYDPTSIKASMGAIFSVTLIQSSWHEFQQWQQANQMMLVGTSDHARSNYQEIRYQRPMILLMGSEREGLTPEMETACDQVARIPMAGRSDSLNLAVATAVMLYEIYNQSRNLVTIDT